jgi:hypothetical protein
MDEKAIGGKSVYQRTLCTSKSETLTARSIINLLRSVVYKLIVSIAALLLILPLVLIFLVVLWTGKDSIFGHSIKKQEPTDEEVEWSLGHFKEEAASEWLDLSDEGIEVPTVDFGIDNYGNLLISARDSNEWHIIGRDM